MRLNYIINESQILNKMEKDDNNPECQPESCEFPDNKHKTCHTILSSVRTARGGAFANMGDLCLAMLAEGRLFQALVHSMIINSDACYTEYISPPLATLEGEGEYQWETCMPHVAAKDMTSVTLGDDLELSTMQEGFTFDVTTRGKSFIFRVTCDEETDLDDDEMCEAIKEAGLPTNKGEPPTSGRFSYYVFRCSMETDDPINGCSDDEEESDEEKEAEFTETESEIQSDDDSDPDFSDTEESPVEKPRKRRMNNATAAPTTQKSKKARK